MMTEIIVYSGPFRSSSILVAVLRICKSAVQAALSRSLCQCVMKTSSFANGFGGFGEASAGVRGLKNSINFSPDIPSI